MGLLWPRRKPLRMVWKVEKGGKTAFLVGHIYGIRKRFLNEGYTVSQQVL